MNTKLNHYNRRIAPRLAEVIPLVLHTDRNMVESGRAINISSSGMRLVVQGGLAENEEVTLYFHLRGESSEVLQVGGRAVWQEKLGSFGTHVVGLAFHEEKEPRGRISRWLKRQGSAA
ncbi:MAG TPA: PilZ domain-containing protein [Phycisphaerales bacterium]|nr:PilZ domain-containing protein [Phycisphaerales bacterium]